MRAPQLTRTMRRIVCSLAVALAACGQTGQPAPLESPGAASASPIWFICDGIDQPVVLAFERADGAARMAEYEKPSGALNGRREFTLGATEGAAGSVYTELRAYDAEQGFVRELNPGMLETPGAAYTPYFSSVELDQREISCRWLPRTRVLGFTGRRSFVVHEDADGDLIYTTYDFADAAQAQPIELSENARTTSFSVEVRGGEETTGPRGVTYSFDSRGYRYVVTLRRDRTGDLQVFRDGTPVQSEPLIAFAEGDGE